MEKEIKKQFEDRDKIETKKLFSDLIQADQYVGELYSINYESANVQVHDIQRQRVGGIPSLSFLIATRINSQADDVNFKDEDASVLLLRVMDAAQLPNSSEAERIRVETAQRVSGETDKHWDREAMDPHTRNYLSYAGVKCRVIGTFFIEKEDETNPESKLNLRFGCDISNYYPNRGLKVFKPNAKALQLIVNYTDPTNNTGEAKVRLGEIRYASTNRQFQGVSSVHVYINPNDLLAQKSALFGMTRTGKSNTTKIILQSVYDLRFPKNSEKPLRIGQIVFDPNGEYANENTQDQGGGATPTAIKNIWQGKGVAKENEVVTYGIMTHPNDPDRKMMLLNFFLEDNLQIGKEIIDGLLQEETAAYIKNFCQVKFDAPDASDRGELTRFNRRVFAYRAILNKAGLRPPTGMRPVATGLFGSQLLDAMANSESDNSTTYASAAAILRNTNASWDMISNAMSGLEEFIRDRTSGYGEFENWYVNEKPNASGERWADESFLRLLSILQYANGTKKIGSAIPYHTNTTTSDYAEDIYNDLVKGKLVIIDQSSGEPDINKASADRIMTYIFKRNQAIFREGKPPHDVLVYVEEAHNLLPNGKENDLQDIWVRTAKEGAKYRIGLVYATQEVSSIQKNILKNTSNWFIAHLNNTDETRELCKYYDFADFEPSIRRAQDKGFLRVKTMSNLFVIPVQVKKFDLSAS